MLINKTETHMLFFSFILCFSVFVLTNLSAQEKGGEGAAAPVPSALDPPLLPLLKFSVLSDVYIAQCVTWNSQTIRNIGAYIHKYKYLSNHKT